MDGDAKTNLPEVRVQIGCADSRAVPEWGQTDVPADADVPSHTEHHTNAVFTDGCGSNTNADGAESGAGVQKESRLQGWIKAKAKIKRTGAQPHAILGPIPTGSAASDEPFVIQGSAHRKPAATAIGAVIATGFAAERSES